VQQCGPLPTIARRVRQRRGAAALPQSPPRQACGRCRQGGAAAAAAPAAIWGRVGWRTAAAASAATTVPPRRGTVVRARPSHPLTCCPSCRRPWTPTAQGYDCDGHGVVTPQVAPQTLSTRVLGCVPAVMRLGHPLALLLLPRPPIGISWWALSASVAVTSCSTVHRMGLGGGRGQRRALSPSLGCSTAASTPPVTPPAQA
jgi:hypothetical protein